jgi:hypothetical protein
LILKSAHLPAPRRRNAGAIGTGSIADAASRGASAFGIRAAGRADVFPSKEIAEQHALDFIAKCYPHARSWFDHLGAWPEGEAPDE